MAAYCQVYGVIHFKSPAACTPGSAPGPTLGNEYGKTLPFLHLYVSIENGQPSEPALCAHCIGTLSFAIGILCSRGLASDLQQVKVRTFLRAIRGRQQSCNVCYSKATGTVRTSGANENTSMCRYIAGNLSRPLCHSLPVMMA